MLSLKGHFLSTGVKRCQLPMSKPFLNALRLRPPYGIPRTFRSSATANDQASVGEIHSSGGFAADSYGVLPLTASTNLHPLHEERATKQFKPTLSKVNGNAVDQDFNNGLNSAAAPAYFRGSKFDRVPYWRKISRWQDVTEEKFLSYRWTTANDVQGEKKLYWFLSEALPEKIPNAEHDESLHHIKTREDFIKDVLDGLKLAPMSIRITPHILACIDWNNPLTDPLRRQFIPMKSTMCPDHPRLKLDSLNEQHDSAVEGLVHRYPDKCLFLATSHCPLYCTYCTRSYGVGADTETVTKASIKPKRSRWEECFAYIENTPAIQDVVLSGGDSYSLQPELLRLIGERLLSIPHVRRFRIATKGLAVSPSRILDPNDTWTDELIRLSRKGKECGKQVALHTHFNHANEISWVNREAAQRLFANGVVVRNQSVLLNGVNDSVETMGELLRELADSNIQPYYVYQCDMVPNVENLRTPLQTILDIEQSLRGSIAGFMTPQFVVDLPEGGGKRLASSYESYDRVSGRSTFKAPAVKGKDGEKEGKVFEYWDPLPVKSVVAVA